VSVFTRWGDFAGQVWVKSRVNTAPESLLYERLPDFAHLVERLDPRGAFRNDWLEQHVLGGV